MRLKFMVMPVLACVLTGCFKSDLESCIDAAVSRIEEERADEIPDWPPGAMDIVKAGYKQQCMEMLYRKNG